MAVSGPKTLASSSHVIVHTDPSASSRTWQKIDASTFCEGTKIASDKSPIYPKLLGINQRIIIWTLLSTIKSNISLSNKQYLYYLLLIQLFRKLSLFVFLTSFTVVEMVLSGKEPIAHHHRYLGHYNTLM